MWNLLKKSRELRILSLLTLSLLVASCGGDHDTVTTTVPVQETAATAAATTTTAALVAGDPTSETTAVPDDTRADGGEGRDDVAAAGVTVPEPKNAAPTVRMIADSDVAAGDVIIVDLSSFFSDPDGDELLYEAASSDVAVAVVSVSGSEVSIEGVGEGAAMVTVTARDPGGLWNEQSFSVVVRRWVVSLEVADVEPLTAVGEARQLSVSAYYSDGSRQTLDAGLVQWHSSDLMVAGVFDGEVTAVGAGNARITAAYEEQSVEVVVSVRISVPVAGTVRVLYASPADREFRHQYSEAIANALVDLQSWYRRQLGGLTFSLYDATPERCRMDMPADFYVPDSWEKVVEGVQHCAPVEGYTSEFAWVVYADVDDGECGDMTGLGRGGPGLTIMGNGDLEGLVGNRLSFYDECNRGPFDGPIRRWIGGAGHELAHALGLLHPPGCEQQLPTCDRPALMWDGYGDYPRTYLRVDEKEALMRSPFIAAGASSGPVASAAVTQSRVQGALVGPDGSATGGARVSLVSEDFWTWATTRADGTFEIAWPDGSLGPAVVSVHANENAACRWLGYYDGSGGLTALQHHAEKLSASNSDISDVNITLQASPDEMCRGQRTITGTVLGPDAEPVEEVWVGNYGALGWTLTGTDGTFEIRLPEGTSGPSVLIVEAPQCGHLGYYSPDGLTSQADLAAIFEIGGVDTLGVEITLPASVHELCAQRDAQ